MQTERTKVDWCFNDKAKEVGYWYYVNDYVTNITKKGNIYSCNVDKYKTMVQFSTNRKEEIDDVECSCSFHVNEDNFCPHVYALVCYAFKVFKEVSRYSTKLLEKYKNININKIKKEFEQGNIDIIDLDILGYKYENLFPDRNDEPLFDVLDAYIESMPIDVLEKAKKQTILEGEDTSILDKAIKNKLAHQQKLEEEEKLERKRRRKSIFAGFIYGLFGSKKENKNEKISLYEKDYEPYQFEEEELEEDDYHYDDLD